MKEYWRGLTIARRQSKCSKITSATWRPWCLLTTSSSCIRVTAGNLSVDSWDWRFPQGSRIPIQIVLQAFIKECWLFETSLNWGRNLEGERHTFNRTEWGNLTTIVGSPPERSHNWGSISRKLRSNTFKRSSLWGTRYPENSLGHLHSIAFILLNNFSNLHLSFEFYCVRSFHFSYISKITPHYFGKWLVISRKRPKISTRRSPTESWAWTWSDQITDAVQWTAVKSVIGLRSPKGL